MNTHLEALLAPDALTAVFQPVIAAGPDEPFVFGYEGLIRGPARSNFEQADVLFSYVRHKRGEDRVDQACVTVILETAPELPAGTTIGINVHAATLGRRRDFADFVVAEALRNGIAPHRVMLEIVEHGWAWSEPDVLAGASRARQLGLALALDDIGAGLSNYKMIIDIRPDFFKIDRYLVSGCSRDPDRRKVLASIRDLATAFDGRAIAEGVEQEGERQCLIDLGIELMQGFLFARPQAARVFQEAGRVCAVALPLAQPSLEE